RRPDRTATVWRNSARGHARFGAACQVSCPQKGVARLEIPAHKCDACLVRGEGKRSQLRGCPCRLESFSRAVEPRELDTRGCAARGVHENAVLRRREIARRYTRTRVMTIRSFRHGYGVRSSFELSRVEALSHKRPVPSKEQISRRHVDRTSALDRQLVAGTGGEIRHEDAALLGVDGEGDVAEVVAIREERWGEVRGFAACPIELRKLGRRTAGG